MAKYNGHKNWNHWNVSLWINNDERLYRLALDMVDSVKHSFSTGLTVNGTRLMGKALAAYFMFCELKACKTPDGAPYSVTTIRAAMVGM